MLFGPLAGKRAEQSEAERPEEVWHSWCFHDAHELTEEGVMPDVAALMDEVHAASWQAEGHELLSTDATWRFPDLAPRRSFGAFEKHRLR